MNVIYVPVLCSYHRQSVSASLDRKCHEQLVPHLPAAARRRNVARHGAPGPDHQVWRLCSGEDTRNDQ